MGFRQTETDFEYKSKMFFKPTSNNSEAGISIFQKDNNYFTLTVIKESKEYMIQLKLSEPKINPKIIFRKNIPEYDGEIIFKVESKNNTYSFYYSNDEKEFNLLGKTKSNHVLSKKYTGAYLGVYATSNGTKSKEYADFDWISYKTYERP